MARLKKHLKKNYTVISNDLIKDEDLSWKARGILIYLLGQSDDWTIHLKEVARHATGGYSSFRSGIKELEEFGYFKTTKVHEDGQLNFLHEVSDTKFYFRKSSVENQDLKINSRKSTVENQHIISTNLTSTNLTSTKEINTDRQTETVEAINILECYEENISALSPFIVSRLNDYKKDLSSELIVKAIQIAVEQNKRSMKYIAGILNNWDNLNIRTLEAFEAHEERRNKHPNKKQVNPSKQVPSWHKEGKTTEYATEEEIKEFFKDVT